MKGPLGVDDGQLYAELRNCQLSSPSMACEGVACCHALPTDEHIIEHRHRFLGITQ